LSPRYAVILMVNLNPMEQASPSPPHHSTTTPPQTLTRKDLPALSLSPLAAARNLSKAQVSVGEWPPGSGRRVVVKDLRGCPLWIRLLNGRLALMREWQALQALRDMPEVPNPVARLDADAIVMEARQGQQLSEMPFGTLPPTALEKLKEFIVELHNRGVTHGDMHRDNVLLDEDGQISVIDWASVGFFGPSPSGWKAASFASLKSLDERALLKLKLLHAPATLTVAERDILRNGPSGLYRFVKRLRFYFAKLRGKNPDPRHMFISPEMVNLLETSENIGDNHK
jgi:serine/threonine protein kinase